MAIRSSWFCRLVVPSCIWMVETSLVEEQSSIQMASEYQSTSPVFIWWYHLNMSLDFICHLNTRLVLKRWKQNGHDFFPTIRKPDHYSNGPTVGKPDCRLSSIKKNLFLGVWYSDDHCIKFKKCKQLWKIVKMVKREMLLKKSSLGVFDKKH
jgi:hypothetical protein